MLYSRPDILTPILLAQKEAYLQHLAAALSNPVKLGRHALLAHVNFITGHSSTAGSFATEVDAPTLDALVLSRTNTEEWREEWKELSVLSEGRPRDWDE